MVDFGNKILSFIFCFNQETGFNEYFLYSPLCTYIWFVFSIPTTKKKLPCCNHGYGQKGYPNSHSLHIMSHVLQISFADARRQLLRLSSNTQRSQFLVLGRGRKSFLITMTTKEDDAIYIV